MTQNMNDILAKISQAAVGDHASLPTREALIAALVLDRADWLIDMKFTIAEALDRIGPQWAELVPELARIWTRQQAALSTRYSYEILQRPEDAGGGYQLRLLDDGQEVDGGVFPAAPRPRGPGFGDMAYSETVAAAHAWLDSRLAAASPDC